jgi:hypothetical protein
MATRANQFYLYLNIVLLTDSITLNLFGHLISQFGPSINISFYFQRNHIIASTAIQMGIVINP